MIAAVKVEGNHVRPTSMVCRTMNKGLKLQQGRVRLDTRKLSIARNKGALEQPNVGRLWALPSQETSHSKSQTSIRNDTGKMSLSPDRVTG